MAASCLERISIELGEKITLMCSTEIIKQGIQSQAWEEQAMGFWFLGTIAETCKREFKSNIEDVAKMAVSGFAHPHPRVKFEALKCTGTLLSHLAPKFQQTFSAELLPALISLINTESHQKLKYQGMLCLK